MRSLEVAKQRSEVLCNFYREFFLFQGQPRTKSKIGRMHTINKSRFILLRRIDHKNVQKTFHGEFAIVNILFIFLFLRHCILWIQILILMTHKVKMIVWLHSQQVDWWWTSQKIWSTKFTIWTTNPILFWATSSRANGPIAIHLHRLQRLGRHSNFWNDKFENLSQEW